MLIYCAWIINLYAYLKTSRAEVPLPLLLYLIYIQYSMEPHVDHGPGKKHLLLVGDVV